MITEVIMPKLGQTMEEGLLVEWFKREGDSVDRGDLLFTLESDKATLDVEATGRGYLRKILVEEGETVPVLTVVALITGTPDEDIEEFEPQIPGAPQKARTPSSPRAKRLAREKGVDLSLVKGTGEGGRVVEEDVVDYLEASGEPAAAPPSGVIETVPMTGLRGIVAERMAASARSTARVTLVSEVDATALVELRGRLKEEAGGGWGFTPGYNELLGVAVARALSEFPYMNSRLSSDGVAVEHLKEINIGVAVDTDRGLVVLVVKDAAEKDLRAFGMELAELTERALAGRSLPDDLSGGTFTITNLGAFGIDAFTPVINPPEAAVLGIGRVQPKPVVVEDEVQVRQMVTLSLVFDHRLMDGAPAARFLERIASIIRDPAPISEQDGSR